MKRIARKRPGFDCKHAPCQHEKKGDHGIDGGSWFFSVTNDAGDLAVSLEVLTQDYPETVPRHVRASALERPLGELETLFFHCAFQVFDWIGEEGRKCDLLVGGKCWGDCTSTRRMFLTHGDPTRFEPQPEGLWLALESALLETEADWRRRGKETAEKLAQNCPTCGTNLADSRPPGALTPEEGEP